MSAVRSRWNGPIALFVGRLVPYKGADVLLRALARVDVAAVVIGDGPMRGELERLSRDLKLESRIFFLGPLEDDAVAAWYAACDLFVLPSVTRAEAFGLVQLEAMARAKPVISTRLATGVPWVNVDGVTGIVVPPGDSEALAAALQTLAGDAGAESANGPGGARAVRTGIHARADGRAHDRDVRAGDDRARALAVAA